MDDFGAWMKIRARLDARIHKPENIFGGSIWWVAVGRNVGREINGKSARFSRPCLVLKNAGGGLYLCAPLTSRVRTNAWYEPISVAGMSGYVCLNQVRVLDSRRFGDYIVIIRRSEFARVRKAFGNLYL